MLQTRTVNIVVTVGVQMTLAVIVLIVDVGRAMRMPVLNCIYEVYTTRNSY